MNAVCAAVLFRRLKDEARRVRIASQRGDDEPEAVLALQSQHVPERNEDWSFGEARLSSGFEANVKRLRLYTSHNVPMIYG